MGSKIAIKKGGSTLEGRIRECAPRQALARRVSHLKNPIRLGQFGNKDSATGLLCP